MIARDITRSRREAGAARRAAGEHHGVVSEGTRPVVDPSAQPAWMRTGYKFFPYAARQSGQWWVLRFNNDFPEREMYTLFIEGRAAADVTGSHVHQIPLAASIGALKPGFTKYRTWRWTPPATSTSPTTARRATPAGC